MSEKYNISDLINMDPLQLQNYLSSAYTISIPPQIETPDDMTKAAKLLSRATSYYSFFENMRIRARIEKRMMKRAKCDTQLIEDMLMREEIFEVHAKTMNQAYTTISRMITVKQQVNFELRMTGALP